MANQPRLISILVSFLLISLPIAAQKDNQTQVFAAERAARVGNVSYDLFFDLKKGQTNYGGEVTVQFDLSNTESDLRIDYGGPSIDRLIVNGATIESITYDREEGGLTLPASALTAGPNSAVIGFTGEFTNAGAGFHRFVDPEDGLEYHYTDFQPYDAHRMFPCFDQPDLKATYALKVLAPADWTLIANGSTERHYAKDNRRMTVFRKTKPFSTYLFHLSAGAYASFYDPNFRYPLGAYCRQSLAKHMDAERFFEATRKGFDFFDAYFDFPYPFEKYDQIFVPEFNAGAMENVAAVTWTEGFMFRSPPSERSILRRDMVNYHEMAHMWFGDIVTLKWWDDLWLNESFASYMAYVALAGTGNESAWNLATGSKDGALRADQRVTTHPIITEVPDIRAAANIFDAITYNKGLAVLRQWDAYLGGTTFRDGVRDYLKKHAYKNTTFGDFVSAQERAFGSSLQTWVETWLKTSDVNTIQLAYKVKDGKLADVSMLQRSGRSNDVLRAHATDIGLYYADENGKPRLTKTVMVRYDGAKTALPELNGLDAPLFLLPNIGEFDYVKVALDQQSMDWLRGNIANLDGLDTKTQVWRLLWEMVRDLDLSPKTYLGMALEQMPVESEHAVFSLLSGRISSLMNTYAPNDEEIAPLRTRMFDLAKQRLQAAEPGSDWQRSWYGILLANATERAQLDDLVRIYQGDWALEGYPINNQRKWSIVSRLMQLEHPQAAGLAEEMTKADTSARGKNYALYLSGLKSTMEGKRAVWDRVLNDESLSLQQASWVAFGLFTSEGFGSKSDVAEAFLEDYFELVPKLYKEREWEYASRMISLLFPENAGRKAIQRGKAFLKKNEMDDTLHNLILEQIDSLEKREDIRDNWKDSADS